MFEEQISPLAQGLLAQIEVYSRAFDARILRKLNLDCWVVSDARNPPSEARGRHAATSAAISIFFQLSGAIG